MPLCTPDWGARPEQWIQLAQAGECTRLDDLWIPATALCSPYPAGPVVGERAAGSDVADDAGAPPSAELAIDQQPSCAVAPAEQQAHRIWRIEVRPMYKLNHRNRKQAPSHD